MGWVDGMACCCEGKRKLKRTVKFRFSSHVPRVSEVGTNEAILLNYFENYC